MKPEERVELLLWDWLITKGGYVKEIYFNRKNEVSKVFSVKGTKGRKPDFLIEIDKGFGVEYLAVEIKSSNRGKDVYDAQKILDYYEDYFLGKAKYYVDKKEVKISHFAIATDNSIKGHLLKDETAIWDNYKDSDNLEYKKQLVDSGCYPQLEYYATGLYLRLLWANWRRLRKKHKFTKAPSIGILMTDLRNENKEPYLFTMVCIDWLDKKSSWGQRFWRL